MKRYKISPLALKDLDAIWDYAAGLSGLAVAEKFILEIEKLFITLAQSPGIGVSANQIQKGIRKFSAGNFLIYYRSIQGGIAVVRILHGKRLQKKAFRKTGQSHNLGIFILSVFFSSVRISIRSRILGNS